jgi:hypothetical protein
MPKLIFQFSRPDFNRETFKDRMVSEGITKLTRSEICHVDFVTSDSPDATLIGAHIDGGVQERPANYETWGLRIRVSIPVTDAQAAQALSFARSKIGTPYDAEDILGIAIGDSRLHDAQGLICSCLASNILDNPQYQIVPCKKDHWQINPEELRFGLGFVAGSTEERIEGN